MADYVRPPYLEELPPIQRLPDYVPVAPSAPEEQTVTAAAATPVREPVAATSSELAPKLAAVAPGEEAPVAIPPREPAAVTAGDGAAAAAPPQTVKLSGRISSAVHVVERRGSTAVSFSLLETAAAGSSTTHRVYATKQFAERLAKQQLSQGAVVEVAGQPQLREERQPDGSTNAVAYLYCFGVRVLATTPA